MTPRVHKTKPRFQPQLEVVWEQRSGAFWADLRALLLEPRPHPIHGRTVFYDSWLGQPFPARALAASVLLHVAFFIFPVPHWRVIRAAEVQREKPEVHLTWYGPSRDLPPLRPAAKPRATGKSLPGKAAGRLTAPYPRQTIVSSPLKPNHPRQTLIQPLAPPTPPKILPPLPNIVQWSEATRPARPKPVVTPLDVRRARARRRATRPVEELPMPLVPTSELRVGELNIASSALANPHPRMPVAPMSVPKAGPRRVAAEADVAPDVLPAAPLGAGAGDGLLNLIALSPDPAPPAPNLEIPPGNLAARFAAGPSFQPGLDGGLGSGGAGAGGAGNGNGGSGTGGDGIGGGGSGPPGILISGGNPENTAPVSGPGSAIAPGGPRGNLPARPQPRGGRSDLRLPRPVGLGPPVNPRASPALGSDYVPSSPEVEQVLGPKRIYTLHINMPNLTSAAGSWILRFAELQPDPDKQHIDLSAPVPLRKVDPRYPPVLIEQRIEGEVRLYAIIRKDGSVDSIEVLRSVEPQLDRNAMEALARWKFQPAQRSGTPVDVEAVVSIPFRLTRPL